MSDHEGKFTAKVGSVYRTVVLASYHEEKVAALEAQRDKLAGLLRKVLATHDYHADDGKHAADEAHAALSAQQSEPERVSVPVELAERLVARKTGESVDDEYAARAELRALLASHGRGEA